MTQRPERRGVFGRLAVLLLAMFGLGAGLAPAADTSAPNTTKTSPHESRCAQALDTLLGLRAKQATLETSLRSLHDRIHVAWVKMTDSIPGEESHARHISGDPAIQPPGSDSRLWRTWRSLIRSSRHIESGLIETHTAEEVVREELTSAVATAMRAGASVVTPGKTGRAIELVIVWRLHPPEGWTA